VKLKYAAEELPARRGTSARGTGRCTKRGEAAANPQKENRGGGTICGKNSSIEESGEKKKQGEKPWQQAGGR